MNKKTITKAAFILLAAVNICWACGCGKSLPTSPPVNTDANSIDAILKQLNQKTKELQSYQCQIEYLFSQPLFESETLRTGDLYYQRFGKKSKLRINFQTLKQDTEKEQKYIEQYIILDDARLPDVDYKFDGVWLVHIDYQIKTVKCHQLAQSAEPNESVDAFDLVSRNFPMVGFTQADDLQKEFEITLAKPEQGKTEDLIGLHLKVKPDSSYKDDYKSIDFWIDKELLLPAKIIAVSTEDDIYQIKFVKPIINKKLSEKIFDFHIPRGFDRPEIIPLEKKAQAVQPTEAAP